MSNPIVQVPNSMVQVPNSTVQLSHGVEIRLFDLSKKEGRREGLGARPLHAADIHPSEGYFPSPEVVFPGVVKGLRHDRGLPRGFLV